MCCAYLKLVGGVPFCQDLFEKSKLHRVSVLYDVARNSVEWGHIHVSVRVKVVHELNLVDVFEDEVSHGSRLRLRERERSTEGLRAGVLLCTEVAVGEAVISVQIHARVGVVATKPLASPAIVVVFALHHVVRSLKESLLDVKHAVHVENWHDIKRHILQQVDVILVIMHRSV